jgi:hypothetical protein
MNDVFDATWAVLKPLKPEGWLLELSESHQRKLKPDVTVQTPEGPKTVTYSGLEKLKQWRKLKLIHVITEVREKAQRVHCGPKRKDPTHSAATIRKYVRCFMYMNFHLHELPLALRDNRQEWVNGSTTIEDVDLAFHQWKGTLPYHDEGFTRFEDYYLPRPSHLRSFVERSSRPERKPKI